MKIFLLLPLAWLCLNLNAQNITVRDNSTREPIPSIIIKDKNNITVITDNKGKASLSGLDVTDSLSIYNPAYFTKKIIAGSGYVEIGLIAKLFQLDEVIFSANRIKEKKSDVPYQIEIIKQKDIEFGNQPTTGDVLQNTGAVFLQKSQAGGGSASMRGFEANKVLMVIDGVRMNNAIYRGGHLQDVMTIDPNMLDRAEVIFGPSSTMYGSDALGGVMHFYTKNAEFSNDDKMLVKVNTMARYASASQEKTGHIDFNLGWKNFASMTNITSSSYGDLMSGSTKLTGYTNKWDKDYYVKRFDNRDSMVKNSNNNLLVGSGYTQTDIMQRFNIKTGEHLTHNLNFQFSLNPYLPRYDRLAGDYAGGKLKFAENGYKQNRMLGAYTLNFDGKTAITDNIKVILAYQQIVQERTTRRFQNVNRKTQVENVNVLSANIDLFKKIKENHELRYGFEVTSNDVKSTANFIDIKKDSAYRALGETRYADGGNSMQTFGTYISHSWEFSNKFVITDGLRFTFNSLKSTFTDTTVFKFPFKTVQQNNQALTGSLGFVWTEIDNYKVSFLVNTGFRTPNIDDMSKVFESGGNVLIVPNSQIKPEYATNFEFGITKVFEKRYKLDFTGFYTSLQNALVLADYKFNGKDSALYNGITTKTQAMQNADHAYIYGFTAGLQFDFNDNLSFKSIINYTYGRYINSKMDTVVPLDHIPPVFGQTSILYKAKNFDGEFFVRYNGKKSLADYSPSGEDNLPYATVNGMPAWFTLNIRLGYNITKNFRLNAACENLTDNRYRVFASGINAPGRNFIVSLRYKL
ncbi:MAG: TonB-dependent receptor [Bacteroidota bacterium]|nr:TonB-dependent receptor [Bacteroidota bacterium]